MRLKTVLFVLIFIALISFSQAATIYGNVYGPDLKLLKYSIVEINSSPSQNFVAINGNYSFNLNPGVYQINALYKGSQITLKTSEKIVVASEGIFIHDLILFDIEDVENITFDGDALINETVDQSVIQYDSAAIIVIILSIVIAFLIYLFVKRKKNSQNGNKKKSQKTSAKKIQIRTKKIEEISNDEIMNKIYNIIKREKRINQKEIRKEIGMSEAKISLVIADLESRGLIKKIKVGRGNIIVLQTK